MPLEQMLGSCLFRVLRLKQSPSVDTWKNNQKIIMGDNPRTIICNECLVIKANHWIVNESLALMLPSRCRIACQRVVIRKKLKDLRIGMRVNTVWANKRSLWWLMIVPGILRATCPITLAMQGLKPLIGPKAQMLTSHSQLPVPVSCLIPAKVTKFDSVWQVCRNSQPL